MAPTFSAVSTLLSDAPENISVNPVHRIVIVAGVLKLATPCTTITA